MWYSPLMTHRGNRLATAVLVFLAMTVFIGFFGGGGRVSSYLSPSDAKKEEPNSEGPPPLKYLPEPEWKAPPVKDPFAVFGEYDHIPEVPKWNQLPDNIATKYGFDYKPPLMIGFTRTWPILIQCVTSYIAAGWPAAQIYVIENTGVQRANEKGELSLQHPYYLGYRALKRLGVNVVRTPALLTFSQLQSFFTSLAHENDWPYYFWSHSDVFALSYEQGKEGVTPAYDQEGYLNIYAVALMQMRKYIDDPDNHWAQILYAYDHLAAVDRDKFDKVGGFDPFIPFYMNDCDFHHRIRMNNFSQQDSTAGMIYDVAAVVDDLRVLFRQPGAARTVTDPNPDAPKKDKRSPEGVDSIKPEALSDKDYFKQLMDIGETLVHMKHRANDRGGRNTWQASQQGGQEDPFYYPARGIAESIELMTELGREVFRRKWGHRECDLHKTRLEKMDMWRVKPDW